MDGQSKSIKPLNKKGKPEYRFNWNTPIQISSNNSERLYCGAQYLMMSMDRGESWEQISPDLTTNDPERQRQKKSGGLSIDNSTAENNTTIYAIAESPKDEKVIWVGTDDGNVQVTTDGGKNWTNTAANIPDLPKGLWVSHVEPSHFDRNTCYVTIDGHKSGDKATYVYKTSDLGNTWTSIVTDEIEGYAHAIIEDVEKSSLLFLGTEFGLHISLDGGMSWKRFENGIPPKVSVRMMAIQARESALVIATHGRGIYIIDDISLLRAITPEVANATLHFFEQDPILIKYGRLTAPFGGAGNFRGANPSGATAITYFMKKRHTFGKMTASLFDGAGNHIKDLPAGKSAGINIINIPIRLPLPKSAPTMNRTALGGSLTPPTLAEGDYILKIKKGKQTYETGFQIMAEPSIIYSATDRKLAHQTQMDLYNMTEQLGYIYQALGEMSAAANDRLILKEIKKKRFVEELKIFANATKELQSSLVSLEGDFYVDESSSLREDISTLALSISQYPGKPSQSQLDKKAELTERMEAVVKSFEAYKAQLEPINEQLLKRKVNPIEFSTFEVYKAS